MKFTDLYIKKMSAPKKKTYIRESDGFTLRIMPSGVKTFLFIYTFDGKRREMNLGNYPATSLAEAKLKYGTEKKILAQGKDPAAQEREAKEERKRTPFIKEFVDEFISRYAKEHNRGWGEIERALKAEIVSRWGKRKITDIKRRDLVLVLDEIKERGAPVMANRVLAYTRKMFSWAVERAVLEVNPFLMMSRPTKELTRERTLNELEIKSFWHNLDDCKMSEQIKRALKLILVLGQRPGEIIGMQRHEIKGDWWEIPASRSKNRQSHRVFLTKTAKQLIGEGEGFIFESPVRSSGNPAKSYEVRTMTHDIKANLPHTPESKVADRIKIPHFTPHDLRRTAATRWAEMGIHGDLIDRLQNHITKQKQGVGHIYNRYSYEREKQQALEAWERKLISIISNIESKVIAMRTCQPDCVNDFSASEVR
ncbi:MAG: site-specific integrase [Geobacteraceae bacterium]|nr:site-specific integrase [Geobacteraceae bacterium]NTW81489.1 site-specific integrase [Geobacteraceae bacterium]